MASPSAQYSLTIRVEIGNKPGMLGRVAGAIGAAGGVIGAVDIVDLKDDKLIRDITVDAVGPEQWGAITAALDELEDVSVVDTTDRTFLMHLGGKIEQRNKHALKTRDDLSMAYTPGVARVCTAIAEDPEKAFQYTIKRNTVAVVSDGTAVLGPRRHRPARRDAGHGGQGDALQGVRGRRRVPDLPGHEGSRRDRRDGQADRPRLRRDQPRGHLRRRAASRSRTA